MSPMRPCLRCGQPSPGTRCASCQPVRRDTRRNRDRPAWRSAYQDPAYRRARTRLRGQPCYWCGQPSDTVDHLTPLARGGTNDDSNLVPACKPCNSRRGGMHKHA